jgi:hypothetical protein
MRQEHVVFTLLLCPINTGGHWEIAFAFPQTKKIIYINPLGKRHSNIAKFIRGWRSLVYKRSMKILLLLQFIYCQYPAAAIWSEKYGGNHTGQNLIPSLQICHSSQNRLEVYAEQMILSISDGLFHETKEWEVANFQVYIIFTTGLNSKRLKDVILECQMSNFQLHHGKNKLYLYIILHHRCRFANGKNIIYHSIHDMSNTLSRKGLSWRQNWVCSTTLRDL